MVCGLKMYSQSQPNNIHGGDDCPWVESNEDLFTYQLICHYQTIEKYDIGQVLSCGLYYACFSCMVLFCFLFIAVLLAVCRVAYSTPEALFKH